MQKEIEKKKLGCLVDVEGGVYEIFHLKSFWPEPDGKWHQLLRGTWA